jgi:hypothetical protein
MTVPVTVIGSAVAVPCLASFELVCANASGASTAQQARVTIVFFIICLPLMLMIAFLQLP